MAEEVNKSKHKRSLSLSKRKGAVKTGKSGSAGTTPITSFFNNAPPPEVACPLCGQLVPRYRINQHIDLQCQNFERPSSSAASGSDSGARSMPLSPTRNITVSSGPGSQSAEKEETNISPYFKKHHSQQEPREIMNKTVVRKIDLGSLSSKLSKRYHIPPERTRAQIEDGVSYPQKEIDSEALSSSQKENHLQVLGEDACSEVINLRSTIDAETPKEKPELPKFESLDKPEAEVSKSETHHTLVPLTMFSPSSKHTKRKKGETSRSKMSVLSKKVKYEDSSSTSGEAFSGEDPAGTTENSQCRGQDPSTKCNTLLNGRSNETHKDRTTVMDEQEEMTTMMEVHMETTTEMESHRDSAMVTEVHESSVTKSGDVRTESGVEKTAKDNDGPHPQRIAYYLRNFRTVLEAVLENEDDRALFNKDDLEPIDAFENLSVMGQKLYVRLFQRKLKWLQVNKLDYEEISSDLGPVAQELVEAGFLQSESDLQDLGEVLDLLPAPELKSLAKTFHLGGSGTQKQQLVDGLLRLSRQKSLFTMAKGQNSIESVILKRAKQLAGHSVRLCHGPRAVFSRVLLLFSMTDSMEEEETAAAGGQSQLYTILLVHSGRLSFPDYTVERRAKLFQDREDLIRYEAATRALQEVITAMQTGHWDEALELYTTAKTSWQELSKIYDLSHQEQLPVFLRCFTTGWAYTRILSRGVEILQRLRRYQEAVKELRSLLAQSVYCPDSRGRWWDRLALNLQQHLKQPEQAIKAIRDGLSDPLVRTGHQLSLHQRAIRMKESPSLKKYRLQLRDLPTIEVQDVPHVTIRGQLFPHEGGMGKSVFLMPADEEGGESANGTIMCSVEDLSLAHYHRQGFDQGIHGEGSTFSTLFGLLLWDIIFMEGIPDVFRNPYQTCPLDHFTDCFYENRREAIETRVQMLQEVSVETLCGMLEDVWSSQEGKVCSLVNWERFSSLQQAQSLVSCLGGVFLGGIIARMAKDYRHCRGGLPDLVVWNTTNNSYKLVEVKGPNDRLSQKQQIWLDELQKLGANVEVCHVTAIGARGAPLDA